ncbi:hypothetical protein OLMES_1066 [Oleiphilus messinensis]|uniref:Uncharacterized protein n=1 Tax=Oleiphilus messinensis TaxID=141451 RepID=A0A1Y0I3V3_9GAMM|nr:hypothetical protein OLMES_1066 [Oleiphilus messinensis]
MNTLNTCVTVHQARTFLKTYTTEYDNEDEFMGEIVD